jgi:hypothetical protein
MKNLIFPDLHEPPTVALEVIERTIDREKPDKIVFLGDYFDQFNDTPADAARMAEWLKESLANPRRVHLVGNHDAAYFWPCETTYCPGFTWPKESAIREVLGDPTTLPFAFHACLDECALSHAGLSAYWVPAGLHPDVVDRWLTAEAKKARTSFASGRLHWFSAIGPKRGGNSAAGGILWCDWHELQPTPGVRQVCGHTPADRPRWIGQDLLCLDTNLGHGPQHFAVVKDGAVEVCRLPCAG